MAKKKVYSFEERKYSTNSLISAGLSLGAALLLILLLFISFLMKGTANAWIGAFGFTGIVMAFCGLRYGFTGFRDDCKSYFCCKLGTILSTVVIAAWFFIVCIGLMN